MTNGNLLLICLELLGHFALAYLFQVFVLSDAMF